MFKLLTIIAIASFLITVTLLLVNKNFRKSEMIMIFTTLFILSTSLLFSVVEALYLNKVESSNVMLLVILCVINILSIIFKSLPAFIQIKENSITKENGPMIIAKMLPCEFLNVVGFILIIFLKG